MIIKNGTVLTSEWKLVKLDIAIRDGKIAELGSEITAETNDCYSRIDRHTHTWLRGLRFL